MWGLSRYVAKHMRRFGVQDKQTMKHLGYLR